MLKRKDKILISAIELLYDEGVNGVTTKNLAKLQNVTEPALYRQYKGKRDILVHIIEEYAGYDLKITNTITQQKLMGKEAIRYYVKRFAELYQNYSELTTVMFSMDLYQYDETSRNRMKEIIGGRLSFLEQVISDSSKEFENTGLDAKLLASQINGTIFSQVYEWRMMGEAYSLEERLLYLIEQLMND